MNITTRQFSIYKDMDLLWDFFTGIYDRDKGDIGAPFFEYAMSSSWMDTSYSFLDRIWFDGDKVVAFVFYEAPVTDIHFRVRPGYEFLADELIDYAMTTMPHFDGKQQFILFDGQEFLKEAAAKRGYKMVFEYEDKVFDFANELNYELPEGYHFVEEKDLDIVKISKLCWYGFGHGDKGEFKDWDKYDDSLEWTPAKSHKSGYADFMSPPPHSTHQYDVIIADENEEYVCYSGMWWVPENHLAYMEPLCTHPDHRRRGLAAAALTRHYRRFKPLGATHMTGGGDPFYEKIGYGKGPHWTIWNKEA
ncbi:MAG: GNAT family N-acetyltransferase [Clostridiales bacterium]|nr:GNAT family N-acetyltransferase [Clostridiales bacterium]